MYMWILFLLAELVSSCLLWMHLSLLPGWFLSLEKHLKKVSFLLSCSCERLIQVVITDTLTCLQLLPLAKMPMKQLENEVGLGLPFRVLLWHTGKSGLEEPVLKT